MVGVGRGQAEADGVGVVGSASARVAVPGAKGLAGDIYAWVEGSGVAVAVLRVAEGGAGVV
ncbi:MAG: hypothetical protein RMJ60_00020, partial [Anaerolineales bacterium]|nr:hypothetical protein [Anaerolineales bacterium]